MSRRLRHALIALNVVFIWVVVGLVAGTSGVQATAGPSAGSLSSAPGGERHHYAISARVRPLLLFWISRSGVGDAVVTKRRGPSETGYSLLIGYGFAQDVPHPSQHDLPGQ